MPSPLVQRRVEEKQARRDAIVDAAERAFTARGIDAATMGDVAAAARLSRALLYTYFDDKDDLLMAVAHRGQSELLTRFEAAAAGDAPGRARLGGIGAAFVGIARELPLHFEALMRYEAREVDPEQTESEERAVMNQARRVIDLMAGVVTDGVADGSIRADIGDPHATALTIWGVVYGAIQLGTFKGKMLTEQFGVAPDALVDRAFDLIDRSLRPSE